MKMLVTRPEPGASAFAEQLRSIGVEPLVSPLMAYEPETESLPPLDGIQAFVFTSSQGVRAYNRLGGEPDRPAFAVGESTAAKLIESGFTKVYRADGDVASLAELLSTRLKPEGGPVAHLCGADVAGDLAGSLRGSGLELHRFKLYKALKVQSLPEVAEDAIRTRTVDAAAFFSPRTSATFVTLTKQAGLSGQLGFLSAFCLSKAVADVFKERTRWLDLYIAKEPTMASLLELIKQGASSQIPDGK